MTESLSLKAKGLSRYADPLSVRAPGSLNTADNVVIDQEGLFSPRRGFERLDGTLTNGQAKDILPFFNKILVYSPNSPATTNGLKYYNEPAGSYTDYTGFSSTDAHIKYAEMNGNLYVTSSNGVYKLESPTSSSLTKAGMPEALYFTATAESTGNSVTASKVVAYKTLWGLKDGNGNLVLGPPSNAVAFTQGPVAKDVGLTIPIPGDIAAASPAALANAYFVRIYKTAEVDALGELTDEYNLVYETFTTSGERAAGHIHVVDQTPDSLRSAGPGLYTNATIEGAQAANTAPPKCADMVVFNNHMFYADLEYKQVIYLQLLASGPSAAYGLTVGDTFTLNTGLASEEVYTAKQDTAGSSKYFQLYPIVRAATGVDFAVNESFTIVAHNLETGDPVTVSNSGGGLPTGLSALTTYYVRRLTADTIAFYDTYAHSVASGTTGIILLTDAGTGTHYVNQVASPSIDIRRTSTALISSINSAGALVYAYYESSLTSLPGQIRLEERSFSDTAFTVKASTGAGSSWSPNIETAQSSTAESIPNGLAYSKFGEPESVPLLQVEKVGSKRYPILRILPLRESLFIFKGDGVWRLTGTSASNFSIDAFNSSTRVVAPNTLCVLNNLVFGLFDQGVCQVSESGVSVISLDIEGDIRGWIGSNLVNLGALSFGFGYETDRKYFMWVPEFEFDTYPTQGYAYNTVTDSWTIFDRSAIAAVINPANDRIYLASGPLTYLSKERKSALYSDFSDEQIDVVASNVNLTDPAAPVITLTSISGIEVGDMYYESDSKFARITAVTPGDTTITVDSDLGWSTAPTEAITVTDVAGAVLTVDSTSNIDIGDVYVDSVGARTSTILKVDRVNNLITVSSAPSPVWTEGPATVNTTPEVRKSYLSTLEWNPVHLNTPGHLKQWYEALLLLMSDFNTATLSFKTDQDSGWEGVDLTGVASDAWGLFPWGEAPWGGGGGTAIGHRTYIPRTKQRAATIHVLLQIDTMFSPWEMSGIELTYRDAGARLLIR